MRLRTLSASILVALASACSDAVSPTTSSEQLFHDVTSIPPSGVIITPAVDTVTVGDTIQLKPTLHAANGSVVADQVKWLWGVDHATVVSVDGSGHVLGKHVGTARVVAVSLLRTGTSYGFATVVVRAAISSDSATSDSADSGGEAADSAADPAPAIPAEGSAPVTSGSLFSGYSRTSPHWPHIRTQMTDFYYAWTPAERAWAGAHYDVSMSGNGSAWRSVNPTVTHVPYTLLWTTLTPGAGPQGLTGNYTGDMERWYDAHPQYDIETAFMHVRGTARDASHRLVVKIWDSMRWVLNVADPGARAYTVDRYQRIVANEGGAFIDEATSAMMLNAVRNAAEVTNAPRDFEAPITSLIAEIKRSIGSKMLMLNTAQYTSSWDLANVAAAGAAHLEMENDAMFSGMSDHWRWIDQLLARGAIVDLVSPYSTSYINGRRGMYPGGNSRTPAERLKLWELASYYMVVGASPADLTLQMENTWSTPYSKLWIKAQEANIGHPRSARSVYRRGTDPLGQSFTVYGRDFDRALVLVRAQQGWGSQRYTDATAVRIPLPAGEQWLPLSADGTLGAPVTSVRLRNSEAAILIKKRTVS